jgi:hypothetical protein
MSTCNNSLTLCKSTKREKFWMDDFSELYKDNNYVKFFPKLESTRVEQLNAITRFLIYFIILSLIFNKNDEWLYIPITGIVIIIILYNINSRDIKSKEKELSRILTMRQDKINKEKELMEQELAQDGDEEYKLKLLEETKPYDMDIGTIDSNGELTFQRVKPECDAYFMSDIPSMCGYSKDKPKSLYSVDELEDYRKNTCRKPSKDNPFMNPDITEFNDGDPPGACNLDDEDIKDDMRVNFNHDLFRDVDELWEKKNSQRQFYTMPNTSVPNNQTEFANWLYKIPQICKSDNSGCLRYEDLRFKR